MRDTKRSALFARKRLITIIRGPHCKRFHPNTEDSIMVQERLQSFLILACEKDLTDLIDLEDVTMNSGDLRGDHGSRSNAVGC